MVYEPPQTGEDVKGRNARLKRMRRALNKYEKEHEPIVDNASVDMDIDNESAEIDMDIERIIVDHTVVQVILCTFPCFFTKLPNFAWYCYNFGCLIQPNLTKIEKTWPTSRTCIFAD